MYRLRLNNASGYYLKSINTSSNYQELRDLLDNNVISNIKISYKEYKLFNNKAEALKLRDMIYIILGIDFKVEEV
jgi:hypothetical protein